MIKKILKNSLQSELIRNSSILITGSVVGQGIAFLALLLLGRLYSETDFALMSTFATVCFLLSLFATGRYEESLVIARDTKETNALLGFSLKWMTIFVVFLFIVLFFFRSSIFSLLKWEELEPFWWYIPPTVFFLGLFNLLTNLAIHKKQFKQITSTRLIQTISNTLFKLIFGFLSFTQIGLIASNMLSQIAGNLPFYSLLKNIKDSWREKWKTQKQAALRHKDFPHYNLGRTFISAFSINLPFLVLISVFDSVSIGFYAFAWNLLYRPLSLVSDALYSTFFKNITVAVQEEKPILPSLKKYWKLLCLYILPCFILAFALAQPSVFGFVFSAKWEETAIYFRYLLPWMFMLFVVSPVHFIPIVLKKQNIAMVVESIYLTFRIIALAIGIYSTNFQLCIFLFCATGFLFSSVLLIWFYCLVKKYDQRLILK